MNGLWFGAVGSLAEGSGHCDTRSRHEHARAAAQRLAAASIAIHNFLFMPAKRGADFVGVAVATVRGVW